MRFLIFSLLVMATIPAISQNMRGRWWEEIHEVDSLVSTYIKFHKSEYSLTVFSMKAEGDSSWVYLNSFSHLSQLKSNPPDFIMNYPEGKVACYTGFRQKSGLNIDWYEIARKEVGSLLCDNLHLNHKQEGNTVTLDMKCSFMYDPYLLKLTLYKGKLLKSDFLREPYPDFNKEH